TWGCARTTARVQRARSTFPHGSVRNRYAARRPAFTFYGSDACALPSARRGRNRTLSRTRAPLRLRRQLQGRIAGHRAVREDRERGPDRADRPAADCAGSAAARGGLEAAMIAQQSPHRAYTGTPKTFATDGHHRYRT